MNSKIKYISKSKEMKNIYRVAKNIATSNVNVLIYGESGTGKSQLAKIIHNHKTDKGVFLAIDMAATNSISQKEATKRLKNIIEECQKGTILVNNIADASPLLQSIIVSELILKEENKALQDIRFIATTDRNLSELARQGRFRQDLYDILSVVSIEIPPLKSRKEDIEGLSEIFLNELNQNKVEKYVLSDESLSILQKYDFPGNVRELKNIITQSTLSSDSNIIMPNSLPTKVRKKNPLLLPKTTITDELYKLAKGLIESGKHTESISPYDEYISIIEKPLIQAALDEARGNKSEAAKAIKINRNTLSKKIQDLCIE